MSEKEEMLKLIDKKTEDLVERFDAEELKIWRAIRSLIEKFFEWQEMAIYVLANIALGDEPDDKRIYKALKLLEAIRDFGEEGDDE